mmetsp:Transcript_90538/g.201117  ORF Transcript_90538/g.201117 Transcript_90538/m.201117 type:complete len:203 (+) Transcript_90538:257-865(+)
MPVEIWPSQAVPWRRLPTTRRNGLAPSVGFLWQCAPALRGAVTARLRWKPARPSSMWRARLAPTSRARTSPLAPMWRARPSPMWRCAKRQQLLDATSTSSLPGCPCSRRCLSPSTTLLDLKRCRPWLPAMAGRSGTGRWMLRKLPQLLSHMAPEGYSTRSSATRIGCSLPATGIWCPSMRRCVTSMPSLGRFWRASAPGSKA